jgi:hypothetical protein
MPSRQDARKTGDAQARAEKVGNEECRFRVARFRFYNFNGLRMQSLERLKGAVAGEFNAGTPGSRQSFALPEADFSTG